MSPLSSEFDLRTYLNPMWLRRAKAYMPEAELKYLSPLGEKTLHGVDASTARGMTLGGDGKDEGPLKAFEDWAVEELRLLGLDGSGVTDNHRRLWESMNRSQADFDEWHAAAAERLRAHWKRCWLTVQTARDQNGRDPRKSATRADGSPRIAHKYKLVDLFVRRLRITAPRGSALAQAVRQFGHIPLDRKSLALIGATVGHIVYGPSSSMGDVRTELAYRTYQRLTRAICQAIGPEATPILFDFFVWNAPAAQKVYAGKKKAKQLKAAKLPKAEEKGGKKNLKAAGRSVAHSTDDSSLLDAT
ncbi:hypothetical protein [Caballeronia sp. SBC2]|uniref:hypothetical protein n=1 Tax=Caballeronia sp. SBC2 TaxID=2705547 RepID=UPI0013EDE1B7|nr:hypothetical protein [Caballeronia sp. SBC2]